MKTTVRSSLHEFKKAVTVLDFLLRKTDLQDNQPGVFTPYKISSIFDSAGQFRNLVPSGISYDDFHAILIDELSQMVLPVILDNGANYLAMEISRNKLHGLPDNSRALEEKFSILADSGYMEYLLNKIPEGYGFIAYPGYVFIQSRDFVRMFPGHPEHYFEYMYPVIYELQGLRTCNNNSVVPGWLCFAFIKPAKMHEQVAIVREKTLETLRGLEKLNVKLAGLGGLLASITQGGAYLEDKAALKITTGHSCTVANIMNTMDEAASITGLKLDRAVIAIVGGGGSIGSGLAKMCAKRNIKELVLIDTGNLDIIMNEVNKISDIPVSAGNIDRDIPRAHIVLIATNSPKYLVDYGKFMRGAIILDDSQPKNVSEDVINLRSDVLLLESGAVKLPENNVYHILRAFGPHLKPFSWNHINIPMTGKNEVPACLAEVMVWSMLQENRDRYSIGSVDADLCEYLNLKGSDLGFKPGDLQSYGKLVSHEKLEYVAHFHGEL